MHYDFDDIIDRRGSGSLKWDRYAEGDVIPMWVADMDFPAPPAVISALRQFVETGVFGYAVPPEPLVETVQAWMRDQYGWTIEAKWVQWVPGLVSALNVICRAVGASGDGVATFTPIYPPFLSAPRLSDRQLVTAPLVRTEAGWHMDLGALEASLTPRTGVLLLCSPHNPVGRAWSREELLDVADLARRHDLVVCADEIHCDLRLRGQPHVPFASLGDDPAGRSITLMAPSKTFNLPGLSCGLAIIPNPDLRRRFERAAAGIVPWVNGLGYAACLAAYRDSRRWHGELLEYLRANADLVERFVAERLGGLSMAPVEATYLAWLDARAAGLGDPARHFLDAGVALSDGREFGTEGFVRLNFGCPRALLVKGLERMERALHA